jgi:hypothetical protein
MSDKEQDLMPCPFCGGDTTEIMEDEYALVCGVCGCEGRYDCSEQRTLMGKVKAWNTRPANARDDIKALKDERDRYRDALEKIRNNKEPEGLLLRISAMKDIARQALKQED